MSEIFSDPRQKEHIATLGAKKLAPPPPPEPELEPDPVVEETVLLPPAGSDAD